MFPEFQMIPIYFPDPRMSDPANRYRWLIQPELHFYIAAEMRIGAGLQGNFDKAELTVNMKGCLERAMGIKDDLFGAQGSCLADRGTDQFLPQAIAPVFFAYGHFGKLEGSSVHSFQGHCP